MFAFDYYYVPGANGSRTRCATKSRAGPSRPICGPTASGSWGSGSRIYYYLYFDPSEKVMAGANVFELEPNTFRLTRQISGRARRTGPVAEDMDLRERLEQRFHGDVRRVS